MDKLMQEINDAMDKLHDEGAISDEVMELKALAFLEVELSKKSEKLCKEFETLDFEAEEENLLMLQLFETAKQLLAGTREKHVYDTVSKSLFKSLHNLAAWYKATGRQWEIPVLIEAVQSDVFHEDEQGVLKAYRQLAAGDFAPALESVVQMLSRELEERSEALNLYTVIELVTLGTSSEKFKELPDWKPVHSFFLHLLSAYQLEMDPSFAKNILDLLLMMPKGEFLIENKDHQLMLENLITDATYKEEHYFETQDHVITGAEEMRQFVSHILSSDLIVLPDSYMEAGPWEETFLSRTKQGVETQLEAAGLKEAYKVRQCLRIQFTGDSGAFARQYGITEQVTRLMKRSALDEMYQKFPKLGVRVLKKQAVMTRVNSNFRTRQSLGSLFGYRDTEDYYFFDYQDRKLYWLSGDRERSEVDRKRMEEVHALILYLLKAVKS